MFIKKLTGILVLFSFLLVMGQPIIAFNFKKNQIVNSSDQSDESKSGTESESESKEVKVQSEDFIHQQNVVLIHLFYSKSIPYHYLLSPLNGYHTLSWTPPETALSIG
jgi:Na+/glutamate symporter